MYKNASRVLSGVDYNCGFACGLKDPVQPKVCNC
jgi:hypothetical protein